MIGDIILLQIANLGAVKFFSLDLNDKGDLVEIQGPNDSGKSTVLNALKFAIEGAAAIPKDIIRHGVFTDGDRIGEAIDRGKIRVETSDSWVIERTIRKNKHGEQVAELSVTQNGESPSGGAQSFLDKLATKYSNPQTVADLSGRDLFKVLSDIAKLDLSAYDNEITQEKDVQKILRKQIKDIGKVEQPAEPRPELPSQEELTIEYSELKLKHQAWDRDMEEVTSNIGLIEKLIIDLEENLEAQRLKLSEKKNVRARLDENPPDSDRLLELKRYIEKGVANQALISRWDDFEADTSQLGSFAKQMTASEDHEKKLIEERSKAYFDAELPVKGLKINEEGQVYYDDALWDNLSESSRLVIATHLCVNNIPKDGLKYIYLHRGESIGTEKRAEVARIAKDANVKVLMEVMSETPENAKPGVVVLYEGAIVEPEVVDLPMTATEISKKKKDFPKAKSLGPAAKDLF